MGLQVKLLAKDNMTMSDIENVYIRLETLQIFPKYGFIKFVATGYINEESGSVMKSQEIADVSALQDVFYTTELLSGVDLQQLSRDEFIPPPQTASEPLPIFRDYYSIYLKDADGNVKTPFVGIDLTDTDAIYGSVYSILKTEETRFIDSRDMLIDPELS